jgi:hypothetical protein
MKSKFQRWGILKSPFTEYKTTKIARPAIFLLIEIHQTKCNKYRNLVFDHVWDVHLSLVACSGLVEPMGPMGSHGPGQQEAVFLSSRKKNIFPGFIGHILCDFRCA